MSKYLFWIFILFVKILTPIIDCPSISGNTTGTRCPFGAHIHRMPFITHTPMMTFPTSNATPFYFSNILIQQLIQISSGTLMESFICSLTHGIKKDWPEGNMSFLTFIILKAGHCFPVVCSPTNWLQRALLFTL